MEKTEEKKGKFIAKLIFVSFPVLLILAIILFYQVWAFNNKGEEICITQIPTYIKYECPQYDENGELGNRTLNHPLPTLESISKFINKNNCVVIEEDGSRYNVVDSCNEKDAYNGFWKVRIK